ncbi:MAG TPA: hypothetical protein VMM35_04595 [Longimicrobiales bacterium]|nr:hypothetical protein [Longimicrobiales bacterium]
MNVRTAALIAEIVGGIGVIVSLIFVGLQVRAEAEAQRAQAELVDFKYRGDWQYESLDEVERYRYQQIVGNALNTYSIAFEYGRLGRVDAEEFASWERGVCALLRRPGYQQIYAEWPMLTDAFRGWIDESCGGSATRR